MKYTFQFPRIDADNIIVEAETFPEAVQKALSARMEQVTPKKIHGEVIP